MIMIKKLFELFWKKKNDVYYDIKIKVTTAYAWKPTETSELWVDPNNGEKKIKRKRNRVKDSEESNFSGRPRRMGSIGKVGLLIKRRQRLERRRPGVHRHRRPGADVGTLGRKRKNVCPSKRWAIAHPSRSLHPWHQLFRLRCR